jgi:nicotinamide-nucleotide amidase
MKQSAAAKLPRIEREGIMSTGLGDDAAKIVEALYRKQWQLVTVESCTAGSLSALIAGCEYASKVLLGGFVVYTKSAKQQMVDVPAWLLMEKTAVHKDVALAMAHGALARTKADVAASITGCAGPTPDEDGNPVGLVYVAIAHRSGVSMSEELRLGHRSKGEIFSASMKCAFSQLDKLLCLGSTFNT